MKTKLFTIMRYAAVWAISLLSGAAMAEDFTPDMFPGQSADRTAFEVSATVNVGDFGKCPNAKSYITAISSSDESVVKVCNENYYGAVLMVGVGTADVTYTETMFSGGADGSIVLDGPATTHTIHYTVEKGVPEAYWEYQGEPVTTYRIVWQGEDWGAVNSPRAIVKVKELSTDNYGMPYMQEMWIGMTQLVFESANPEVATVSDRGVTPVSYGNATISCTWSGSVLWEGVTFSYEASVEEPKENIFINFFQTEVTGFVGESMTALMNMQMHTIDRWASENPEVASVDEQTGQVHFLSAGTTRIFAYIDETDVHYAATGYYTVTVKKNNPELTFSQPVVEGEPGVPFTAPTLNNPYNVPIDKWYSSNPDVASVNEATGEVTVMGVGDANIACEFTGNELYEGAVATYTIHVTTIGLQVMGIEVTSLNADDVLGDGSKKVTFDKQKRTLSLDNWVVDASGIADPAVRKHVIWNHSGETLFINTIGECAINNANVCVVSMTGALLFMNDTEGGKLTLTANEADQSIAIQSIAIKIHEADVTATGSVTAIKVEELTVSQQSHIYAEATGANAYAGIVCGKLLIADEGIQILTPSVHYVDGMKEFFDDEANTVRSKVVEIGKVPVTVPDNEETVVNFSVTDPDDNEVTLFSTSANDTYNEETGQLEISTSLTDEQVATALETLVPGSSAWISLLPGSLVLNVPAGKGEIQINCLTLPGYTLNILIEGNGVVSITQETFGWAKVSYDVAVPTNVVIYLHASSSSARLDGQGRRASSPTASAFIGGIKIIPEGIVTSVDAVKSGGVVRDGKFLKNGQLYIVRDGAVYNVTGMKVKHNR